MNKFKEGDYLCYTDKEKVDLYEANELIEKITGRKVPDLEKVFTVVWTEEGVLGVTNENGNIKKMDEQRYRKATEGEIKTHKMKGLFTSGRAKNNQKR